VSRNRPAPKKQKKTAPKGGRSQGRMLAREDRQQGAFQKELPL
jgi:hypothetical protein